MAFYPVQNTVAISVTASSNRVQIAATDSTAPALKCRVTNTSTTLYVGIQFGDSSVTAAFPTAGTAGGAELDGLLAPGESAVFAVPKGTTYVAAIGSAAGPTYVAFALGSEG